MQLQSLNNFFKEIIVCPCFWCEFAQKNSQMTNAFYCVSHKQSFGIPDVRMETHRFCAGGIVCNDCRIFKFASNKLTSLDKHVCLANHLCVNKSCRYPMITFDSKTGLGIVHQCHMEFWTSYSDDSTDSDTDACAQKDKQTCKVCKMCFASEKLTQAHVNEHITRLSNIPTQNCFVKVTKVLNITTHVYEDVQQTYFKFSQGELNRVLVVLPAVICDLIADYTATKLVCSNFYMCVGCGQNVLIDHALSHKTICKVVQCTACNEDCDKAIFESHHVKFCRNKQKLAAKECAKCKQMIPASDLALHETVRCPMLLTKCSFCGNKKIKRVEMDKHQTVCPNRRKV